VKELRALKNAVNIVFVTCYSNSDYEKPCGKGMQKLLVTRCEVSNGEVKATKDQVEAQLNPDSFKHSYSISYLGAEQGRQCSSNIDRPNGLGEAELRYARVNDETVSFELVIDGTGVVKKANGEVLEVQEEIESLRKIAYHYEGNKHEPCIVRLVWGDPVCLSFYGRLVSMKIDYILFRPSGDPLRAKIRLSFVSFMSNDVSSLRAKISSPDLTH
jgi:hypothetical protein